MMNILESVSNDVLDEEFFEAIKLFCYYYKDIPPAWAIVQHGESFEQYYVCILNTLSKRKRVDLFFEDLRIALSYFDKYEKIKRVGIIFTDIERNEIYNTLNSNKSIVIDNFITRSFDCAYNKARKFKTKDGRNNYMKRYFKSLKSNDTQMYSDNIQRIEALEMMVEINGVEPSAKYKQRRR